MSFLLDDGLTLWRSKRLLWVLTRRELSARYAGSAMGVAWAYLQPLLTMAAYFLVFDVVFAMRMADAAGGSRLGVYLVVGALPWLAFCETLSRGASSLVDAASVLQKNALAPVLFVAKSVLASLLVYAPLMLVLTIAYLAWTGLHWGVLALPVLLGLHCLLMFLLAYICAILVAAVRDTSQVLAFGLSVGIYLSPVLFPISMFPADWQWLLYANPMSGVVMAYQAILLQGQMPAMAVWVVTLAWVLLAAALLQLMVWRSRDQLVDWL
jgi:lipopolysaccharide transport system permease protein